MLLNLYIKFLYEFLLKVWVMNISPYLPGEVRPFTYPTTFVTALNFVTVCTCMRIVLISGKRNERFLFLHILWHFFLKHWRFIIQYISKWVLKSMRFFSPDNQSYSFAKCLFILYRLLYNPHVINFLSFFKQPV